MFIVYSATNLQQNAWTTRGWAPCLFVKQGCWTNDMPTGRRMDIRNAIVSEFERVAREQDKAIVLLTDELPLAESGLDSLCFAIIVARLDDMLGLDPFGTDEGVAFPVTFGEFIGFYEHASRG